MAEKAPRKTAKRVVGKRSAKKSTKTAKSRTTSKTARRKTAARAAAARSSVRKASTKTAAKKKTVSRAAKAETPVGARLASAASAVRGVVAGAVQRVAGSFPWSADENDPIALLESDHRRFEELMKKGVETTERAVKARTALLGALTAALDVHELIEEKILYPALKPHGETRDIVLEGVQEHHVADVLVKELHEVAKDDEQWGAKFKVLQESLEHHIKEEEGTMFPGARKVLSAAELKALGARMRKLKAQEERRPSPRR
jgi:hypothetical protein